MVGQLMPDQMARQLIKVEYLRQVARYRRMDMALTHKYEMNSDGFVDKGTVCVYPNPTPRLRTGFDPDISHVIPALIRKCLETKSPDEDSIAERSTQAQVGRQPGMRALRPRSAYAVRRGAAPDLRLVREMNS